MAPIRLRPKQFANSARIAFPILVADERAMAAWNIQYRYLFDRRRDMNFPISFLIDKTGATVRIYQGHAVPQNVVDDWKSAPTTPEARFARAMPFPGPYYGNAMKRDDFTYGVAFVEYGYVDEAMAAFQRVVVDDPGRAGAWFNLGTIYLNKKMYPDAQRCLREAVRLNPEDSDAWNNLGMIAGEQEKYDEALEDFRQSARANPNHLLAVQNMMRIYQFQARPADAQKAMEELIAKAPDIADLHLGLAMALVAQDDMERAREELETAVRLRPDNVDAINNLGTVLLRTGHAQDALREFERCRQLAPDFDRAVINSAIVYNRAGQYCDGERDTQRVSGSASGQCGRAHGIREDGGKMRVPHMELGGDVLAGAWMLVAWCATIAEAATIAGVVRDAHGNPSMERKSK